MLTLRGFTVRPFSRPQGGYAIGDKFTVRDGRQRACFLPNVDIRQEVGVAQIDDV
jgi:hypothetical protein